jgi:hypothetical protein
VPTGNIRVLNDCNLAFHRCYHSKISSFRKLKDKTVGDRLVSSAKVLEQSEGCKQQNIIEASSDDATTEIDKLPSSKRSN